MQYVFGPTVTGASRPRPDRLCYDNENEQVGKEGALKSKKEVKRRSEVSMEKDSKKKKPIVSE